MDLAFLLASMVVYLMAGLALIGLGLVERERTRDFQYLLRNRKGMSLAELTNSNARFN